MADDATARALSEEALDRLISVLAERRNELRPEHRRYLRERLRIPGFRDPFKAPTALFEQALRSSPTWGPALPFLLDCWASLHQEVVDRVRVSGGESSQLAMHPPDVELARCWLAVRPAAPDRPPADHRPSESDESFPPPLSELLARLQELPPDHVAWDHVDRFVDQVRRIASDRLSERTTAKVRQALRDLLQDLQAGELNPEWSSWSAEACPPDRLEEVLEEVRRLHSLRQEYAAGRQRLIESPFYAQGELLRRQSELHEEIDRIGRRVARFLGGQEHDGETDGPEGAGPSLEDSAHTDVEARIVPAPGRAPSPPSPGATTTGEAPEEVVSSTFVEPSAAAATGDLPEPQPSPPPAPEALVSDEGQALTVTPPDEAARHLARLLTERRVEAGYWYARCLEATTGVSPVPSSLLAVLAASRWLRAAPELAGSSAFGTGLRSIVGQVQDSASAGHEYLSGCVRLAAAIRLALFHPETGVAHWLRTWSHPDPDVRDVVDAVRRYCESVGRPPERLSAEELLDRAEQQIRSAVNRTTEWHKQARRRRISSFTPACRVFWYLLQEQATGSTAARGDNVIYRWLAPVMQDRREDADRLLEEIERWDDVTKLDALFRRVTDRLSRGHSPVEIEAGALQSLRSETQTAIQMARAWIEAVRKLRDLRGRNTDWFRKATEDLFSELTRSLPRALEVLCSGPVVDDPLQSAGDAVLAEACSELQRWLAGDPVEFPGRVPRAASAGPPAGLAVHLLCCTCDADVPLVSADTGLPEPSPDAWMALRKVLEQCEAPSPSEALRARLRREDLRWATLLFDELDAGEPDGLADDIRLAVGRGEELDRAVEAARREVEHATMEGHVAPQERAELLAALEDISGGAGSPVAAPSPIADVASQQPLRPTLERYGVDLRDRRTRLDGLNRKLQEIRTRTLERHSRKWNDLRGRLTSLVSGADMRWLEEIVDEALARGRSILLNELFARLEDACEARDGDRIRGILREWQQREEPAGRFERYAREVRATLIGELNQRGVAEVLAGTSGVPPERGEDFARARDGWLSLKRSSTWDGSEVALMSVLRLAGFRITERHQLKLDRAGRDWAVLRVSLPASPAVPVPEFGSEIESRGGLPVLVVREGSLLSDPWPLLSEAGLADPHCGVLIIYTGRIPDVLMTDLTRWAYRQRYPWAILDEVLFVHLATVRDPLTALFECTLPHSGLNPYRPDHEDNLPPEMFVGREELIRKVLDPSGPIYIYGGRKLGKSSLLGQVRRRFHDPDRGRIAILLSMRRLGDFRDPSEVWSHVVGQLPDELSGRVASGRPEQLVDHLGRLFRRRPELRLLVLLDEADRFLEKDAERGFPNVGRFQALLQETDRRFRTVFTGLHTVRRFQRLPNHPLAGEPLAIGPLSGPEARELIQGRMALLGISVQDDALLDLVALTNYHPGLLQALGRRLVDMTRRSGTTPPFRLTLGDVERLSRDPEVQELIRERFRWTLALDRHYEVLVLGMILDQLETRDGFSRVYTPEQLRQIGVYHWAAGFGQLTLDRVRDYADELCEMAVLSRAEGNRYRLRTPNIVRLLGTPDEMLERLDLAARGPLEPPPYTEVHPPVDDPLEIGPFTQEDLRHLGLGISGVTAVVGSAATGRDRVASYLRALAARRPDRPELHEITVDRLPHSSPFTDLPEGERRLILVHASGLAPRDLERLAGQATAAVSAAPAGRWTRVVLILDPATADLWLPDRDATGIVILRPWTERALAALLEAFELPPELAGDIHEVTCGYHSLIEELWGRRPRQRTPQRLKDSLRKLSARLEPGGDLYKRLPGMLELPRGDDPLVGVTREIVGLLDPERPEEIDALLDVLSETYPDALRHVHRLTARGVLVEVDGNKVVLTRLARRLVEQGSPA